MTKVLIVEDDLLNRMFYEAVFKQRGYQLMVVDDGARVLDAVDSFAPDLITMDIHLPHVSGRKLIRKIQKNPDTRHIPILAITAFAGKQDEAEIRRAGARGYLAKPLGIEELLGEVDSLLGDRQPAQSQAEPTHH
ncbi:response regulator [Aurantiacibacter sp. MUD61]|uniref:response regulator n=1 Tax=Aurantiacibacter sp. MUD61 TaxID=3009083 RepID=UPI0022F128D7|nr:response regulator [Aurantiacibacter sp. MUD61]